jgi:RNA polymerase sigma-70 factor (ECF subfamily)
LSEENGEQAWAQGAQAGSAADFSQLVRAHQQPLRGFLRRLTGNHADADDLAQETFVFAWERIARFDPARPFRPWLFGIAWRKYRERKRGWLRLARREDRFAGEIETNTNPDPGMRLDIGAALGALPPEQRAALLLCLMEQFTHEEAAAALALPLGTVKSHIARGREKLTAMLGGPNG